MEYTQKISMLPSEYLEQRVNDQIAWYERKSARNKRWYYMTQAQTIIYSALIPLFVGFSDHESMAWLKYIGGLLGAGVAILGGIMALKKYKENWLIYRITAETLQREKFLYLNRIGIYDETSEGRVFKIFVERAEQIMCSENSTWVSYLNTKNEGRDG